MIRVDLADWKLNSGTYLRRARDEQEQIEIVDVDGRVLCLIGEGAEKHLPEPDVDEEYCD